MANKLGTKEIRDVLKELKEGLVEAKVNTEDGVYGLSDVEASIDDIKDIHTELKDWSQIIAEFGDMSVLEGVSVFPKFFECIKLGVEIADNLGLSFSKLIKKLF